MALRDVEHSAEQAFRSVLLGGAPDTWVAAIADQLDSREREHRDALLQGDSFKVADFSKKIRALRRLREAILGNAPKAMGLVTPYGITSEDGRLHWVSCLLTPQGWKDQILPSFEALRDKAIEGIIAHKVGDDLSQEDHLAMAQEAQWLIARHLEIEKQGKQALARLNGMKRVAA